MHRRSTILQHLFNRDETGPRLLAFLRVSLLLLSAAAANSGAALAAESDLYRVFLLDGSDVVSYGEFSRVADRVVLSIPVGELKDPPPLELVSIPQSAVDWERTERYSESVRARRFGETRGEAEFALLSARVVEALNMISLTDDPARRLAMALEARQNLVRWPAENFGYRGDEVAQLSTMLDEVISELRVAAGETNRVSLVASTRPPTEALLPPPDLRGTLEGAMAVARITTDPDERMSLLQSIARALEVAPREAGWAAALSARAASDLAAELRIEKAYALLSGSTLSSASVRAARGDLRGVQELVEAVLTADDRLGRRRPQHTSALLGALDWRLGEAARVRLARDAWAARQAAFKTYRRAIDRAVQELRDAKKWLTAIRERSGPSPLVLPRMEQRLVMGRQMLGGISPPPEVDGAHGLYRAAFQMASRAATSRRNAVSSNDTQLEWDAASAAAGALMLLERATEELGRRTSPPPTF